MVRSAALPRLGKALLVPAALTSLACDRAALTTDSPAGAEAPFSEDSSPAAPDPASKIDPRVGLDRQGGRSREVVVLLDDQALRAALLSGEAGGPQPGVMDAVAAGLDVAKERLLGQMGGHRVVSLSRYSHLPALHVELESDEALRALAADPEVVRIVPNEPHELSQTMPPASLALINQPKAAAAGKLGAGATVAVLDTGTDWKRAPFNCTEVGPGCKVVHAADFAPDDSALDANGHGTNVSGIVLAVAPGAQIAALDVFNGDSGWTSDILAAINWVIQNRAKHNIVAMNLSLGGGSFQSTCASDPLAIGIDAARAAGILAVVSSGNGATPTALSSPACAPAAISVGAVHAANLGGLKWPVCTDATTAADKVACFSNGAPHLTLLAPGVMINAAGLTMTGTSQAAPHVAGAIAVLRAAFPSETPAAILKRMTSTGVPVTDARNNITTPRLDLFAALSAPAAVTPPMPGPTGKLVLNAGSRFTKSAAIIAGVATSSGAAATHVCLSTAASCKAWMPWAPTVSWTLPAGDGTKVVNAWWKDAHGNVSAAPATASIVLDTTAPSGGTLNVSLAAGQATFSWSGLIDRGAGVASYKLVVSASGPVPAGCTGGTVAYSGATTKAVVRPLTAKKTYYVRLCATDAIGNANAGFGGPFVAR
jgi:subtilisin family serine protease